MEELNSAQIQINEMLKKYEPKLKELKFLAEKWTEDSRRYEDLKSMLEELRVLKVKIDRISK